MADEISAQDDTARVCDPAIEDCSENSRFKNTIELDYDTPNMIVGVVTIANFLIPYLLYKFYFNTTRTTAVQAIFDAQSKYQFGWYVMNEGAKFIWGPPAFFWIMATLTGDIRFALFLLIWWSSFQTYMTPLIILGTAGPMMWGASISTWEDSYDDVMN